MFIFLLIIFMCLTYIVPSQESPYCFTMGIIIYSILIIIIIRLNRGATLLVIKKKLHLLCNSNIIVPVKFMSGRKTAWQNKQCKKFHAQASLEEKPTWDLCENVCVY